MKKILIIGTARNDVIDSNLLKISKLFNRKKWKYYIFLTKEYKNNLIDEYVFLDKKFISENDRFDFSEFNEIIVCQPLFDRSDYLNIYLFLLNNAVDKVHVIYSNNKIGLFNIKKRVFFLKMIKFLKIYKKMGF